MVMSRSTAVGSIVTGIIILTFAVVTVICGAISAKKLSGQAAASAGLWSLFYAVPGILSIAAGASKNGVVMGFALFFNILAVIISAIASVVLILFTALVSEVVDYSKRNNNCKTIGGMCECQYNDEGDTINWNMNCDDLDTLRTIIIVVLIVYIILTVTTFVASIFGCMGTCCAPADPVVVVAAGAPVNAGGSTVVVASNQSTMHGYNPGMPPAYGYSQPPAYADKSSLVQNMAI